MKVSLYWRFRGLADCLMCRIRGHDWDYFTMTNLDGTPAYFRCCLRCERSEFVQVAA